MDIVSLRLTGEMNELIYENEPFQRFDGINGNHLHDQQQLYANHSVTIDEPSFSGDDCAGSLPQLLHWSEVVYECSEVAIEEWSLAGGSDYGQLPYLLDSGDILLEVDHHKVSGFTRNDVLNIIRSRPRHVIKSVSSSSSFGLPIDLREYLGRRFVRGSVDHDLQTVIRDNVYLRTIPCTTRPARPMERDGIDYKFVTRDEFIMMEKSGVLLESGIYAGHYYGTPLPLSNPLIGTPVGMNSHSNSFETRQSVKDDETISSISNNNNLFLNPSVTAMASKRRRNRSNIAAIDAASLPQGWEKISDAQYGVYYIDHVNKRTQYERPYELELTKGTNGFGFTLIELDKGLILVKNVIPGGPAFQSGIIQPGDVLVSVSGVSVSGLQHSDIARLFSTFTVGDRVKLTFARGYQLPPELNDEEHEFVNVNIEKGENGFGFTISDGNTGQKVKKILDEDRCGNLRQGDLLFSVNGINLSVLPHSRVVQVLKECPVGEGATMTVKRKRRFRSKTPILQPTSNYDIESSVPVRNCKTPSCEMMTRRDMDWLLTDSRKQIEEMNGNQPTLVHSMTFDHNLNHNTRDLNGFSTSINRSVFNPTTKSAPQLLNPPIGSQNDQVSSDVMADSSNAMAGSSNMMADSSNAMADSSNAMAGASQQAKEEFEYYRVTLTRSESGFGFRIIGGSEEGRDIAVGSIVIGGVAHQDGVLKSGDAIISINDQNVLGASHQYVVQLMSQCGPTVSLLVRRRKDSEAFEVTLIREETEGFGFVIISCGLMCLIGRIIDDSPAQRCQRIRVRDQIIAVNGEDITSMSHPDIVNMIKESGRSLRLKIVPSDCYSVELVRGLRGFGFSIRGGAEFNGMPLFILRIAPDGPAFSLLSVGDEIIEINSTSTSGMTHTEAVQLISQSGPQVRLKLRKNVTSGTPSPTTNGSVSGMSYSQSFAGPSSAFPIMSQQLPSVASQHSTYSTLPFSFSAPSLQFSPQMSVTQVVDPNGGIHGVNMYSQP